MIFLCDDIIEVISKNLCITGGCALNGIANYQIEEQGIFENQHFVPNPTDCGLSVGAALFVYHQKSNTQFSGEKEYFSPYVFEEKALEVLEKDSQLEKEFRIKQKEDPEFASSRWAQLFFIYRHSEYYEPTHMVMPVGRVD